jgi:Na+/H+-translocating membrane pyrophosphatase
MSFFISCITVAVHNAADAIKRYTHTATTTAATIIYSLLTTGSATNIIYGLALGYKSVIIPVFVLAAIIYVSFDLCETYGVALAAIGMLATLATGLTIDAYGPVCDNAGTSLLLSCITSFIKHIKIASTVTSRA